MRGCITKRGKTWAFVVEAGKHPVTGKRRQKWRSGFATKAEAEAELAKTLAAMGHGKKIFEPTNETVASYFESWLQQKKQYVRPGTYHMYEWVVNYHLVPRLGNVKISGLTPQHLISTYNDIQQDGLSPQTAKHVHKILNDGLETALKWGVIETNVAKLVRTPKVPKKEMRVWDETQLAQFFQEFTNERYHTFFLVAATTGMRRGEVLGLKWEDIDFEKKKLSVRRAYVRGYKGYMFQEPKTSAVCRIRPLQPEIAPGMYARRTICKQSANNRHYGHTLKAMPRNRAEVGKMPALKGFRRCPSAHQMRQLTSYVNWSAVVFFVYPQKNSLQSSPDFCYFTCLL